MREPATMLPATTFSVSIDRNWQELYEVIWRPETFPKWASGLAQSQLRQESGDWLAQGLEGPIRIRFSPYNAYGVLDHSVELADGSTVHVPLRVIANGAGAAVLLTLFRQSGMDDARFAADAEWVRRDLETLRQRAENGKL